MHHHLGLSGVLSFMVSFSAPKNPHRPELTSHLEGRKIALLYLFIVQACPMLFEITLIPEIRGMDWRGGAEGMRQSLRIVSTL